MDFFDGLRSPKKHDVAAPRDFFDGLRSPKKHDVAAPRISISPLVAVARSRNGGGKTFGRLTGKVSVPSSPSFIKPEPQQQPKKELVLRLTSAKVLKPAKEFRIKENGVCSMFLIDVEPGKKVYRYDVDILKIDQKGERSLVKGGDDGQRSLNRNLCYELLTVAYAKTDSLGMLAGGELVYDCKATLYTSTPINLDRPRIEIEPDEVNDYVRTYCEVSTYSVTITPNQAGHIVDISDIGQYASGKSVFEEDRTVRTFLEMAITQFSINNNVYSPIGAGKLFEVDQDNEQACGNGMILRSGVAKGVRVVQNYGAPKPALVIDAKVCPFFMPQELIKTVLDIVKPMPQPRPNDWGRIRHILSGVRVEVAYHRSRTFAIGKFSDKPMYELFVVFEGRKMDMIEYYKRRFDITLRYGNFPAVAPETSGPPGKRGNNVEYFPIEQLLVMEDQRVPLEKMDKRLSEKLLQANSVRPNERMNKIMRHAHEMAIFNDSNAVLRAFGITIVQESNKIVVGVRSSPRILFARNQIINPNPDTAEWRKLAFQTQYLQTAEITNWVVLCEVQNKPLVTKFVAMVMSQARKKGMRFAKQPIISTFAKGRSWVDLFERCANKNVEFIMLIDAKQEDTHMMLKYLEAIHKVITQHVTVERVIDVVNHSKIQTLENIINKTNCKNFGVNYMPLVERCAEKYALEDNQVLVIGYDVAHPPPVTNQERRLIRAKGINADSLDPSVVGICANMATHPHSFVGDYFYQASRKESVDTEQLAERVTWILQTLERNRGPENARPPYVFILRDGISEGQLNMAYEDEMEAIRLGCLEFDTDYKPKFVFVINTKRHFKKFFGVSEQGEITNMTPGSVINEKFVRPDITEFFMQSHFPLKGVGKPVEYSILVNEIGLTQDELQGFLNALCYSHQIVNSAISLPEPVYQADELAKRGRNNYLCMKKIYPKQVPHFPSGLVDARRLTAFLSYRDDPKGLFSTRFTA